MPTCFVIQPFDQGKFDKRYSDTFEPAIKNAKLDPYRVDQDPHVLVPIEDIEKGIKSAIVCLADITLDNPNVWFELGFAIASRRPVCLVCSDERVTPYPFDIQHRKVIKYSTQAARDWTKLGSDITACLNGIIETASNLNELDALQPTTIMQGLASHEITALVVIAGNCNPGSISVGEYTQEMDKAGYTPVAAALARKVLERKGMISVGVEHDLNSGEPYGVLMPTENGWDWLCENQDKLNLRVERTSRQPTSAPTQSSDDVPF